MPAPKTREVTLYRLPQVKPTPDGMFDALIDAGLDPDSLGANLGTPSVGDAPAVWLDCQFDRTVAEWCIDASTTIGAAILRPSVNSAGLLLIGVDDTVYAIGYGCGHRLIPEELKDPRFGLSFVIRRLDPRQVQDLVRRMPGSGGRTDATFVPAGLPVWSLGSEQHADIISRVGGRLNTVDLTFAAHDSRRVRAEGAAGLRLRLGVQPSDLVADIREIARVCQTTSPDPALEFVEHITPIGDQPTIGRLDAEMDITLSDSGRSAQLVPAVPTSALDDFRSARTFGIKIGSGPADFVHELDAEYFLRRTRVQRPGQRSQALREGKVSMYSDESGTERLGGSSAARWLEVTATIDSRRFFMFDGHWYEIGADYAQRVRAEIAPLFGHGPSLDLPTWNLQWEERDYNEHVSDVRAGYVCLDRKGISDPLGHRSTVEICDLLGPDDELIHVKRASGSSPLSHLFAQGLVSVQSLMFSPGARQRFADSVTRIGKGRRVDVAFTPKKVVFAILLKNGQGLTLDTLFPFSQVTLASTARILQSHQIEVEVIGIDADT